MAPKNLSFEELCDDKSVDIKRLKLEFITINMKLYDLYQEKDFVQEYTLKFIDKIIQIRIKDKLLPLQTSPEIEMYRSEVERLYDKADDLKSKISDLERKRDNIRTKIRDLEDEFRLFRVRNA